MLRALLVTFVTLVVLVIAAVLVVPMLIPASAIRDVVTTEGSKALGRVVVIDGDVKITTLPRVGATVQGVRVANAAGFGDQPFAELEELKVGVALLPLLGRNVKVEELVIVRPVVRLEARADGSNNWTFEPAAPTESAAAPRTLRYGAAAPFRREPGALPLNVALGDVRVVDGQATYKDAAAGLDHTLNDIDVTVTMPALDKPFEVDGSLRLDQAPISIGLTLDTLQAFFDGEEAPAALRLESGLVSFTADGAFAESAEPNFAGDVALTAPSLRALAALAEAPLPDSAVEGVEIFQRLEIKGRASLTQQTAAFENATLLFDAMRGTGDVRADLSGAKPRVAGRLDLNVLDVTPYAPAAPAEAPAQGGAGGGDGGDADAEVAPWPEDPIDLSALGLVDLDFDLTVEGLRFGELAFGAGDVALDIQNGRMTAALTQLDAYEGVVSGAVTASSGGAPRLGVDFTLEGVQGGPLLADAAGFNRAEGQADMTLSVAGDARSMARLMNSLAGEGSFAFTDGQIRGVNLNEAARAIEDLLDGRLPSLRGFGQRQTTDFATLNGVFTVSEGIATLSALDLTNPVIVMDGGGEVDLGAQTVDLRLGPRLVAAPRNDLADIPVPIRLSGPWTNVTPGIDRARAEGMLRDYARGELGDFVDEEIGEKLADELGDELGGAATDALKSILGGRKKKDD